MWFRLNKKIKNTSDNNINISTNTDTMFKIGRDLGEIKASVNSSIESLKLINTKLDNHEHRIRRIEKSIKNGGK